MQVFYTEWKITSAETVISRAMLKKSTASARGFWARIEGKGSEDWVYPDEDYPLYRVPRPGFVPDSLMRIARARHPNIIVFYLESQRGLDVGYLNPGDPRPSATPVLDSLADIGQAWMRMYTSGIPAVGGVLSSHLGFPPHRTRHLATELAAIRAPSYASLLRDSGYAAHFFSAADPASDNLSVWYRKWYDQIHYSRFQEDDSTFFTASVSYIRDTLANQDKPFVVGLMTRSNHYPFTLIPGMPDSVRSLPQKDRMRWSMHWTDRQMGAFLDSIRKEPWFANTYIVVLADHGFPQGEHHVYTLGSGGYANSTWIPFVIAGPGLGAPRKHEVTTGQIDIAPTILALAGVRVPNSFAGHDMLRPAAKSFALGVYAGLESISAGGFRLITGTPDGVREGGDVLFAEEDMYETQSLVGIEPELVNDLHALADTLLLVNDYALSRNHVVKSPSSEE
jgi:phosphoglycerol transferase MdoB-like AlkP superfamily enzyme